MLPLPSCGSSLPDPRFRFLNLGHTHRRLGLQLLQLALLLPLLALFLYLVPGCLAEKALGPEPDILLALVLLTSFSGVRAVEFGSA